MFERFLRVFIFLIYLFDTVFAKNEEHNKGKDNRKIAGPAAPGGVRMEQFVVPS